MEIDCHKPSIKHPIQTSPKPTIKEEEKKVWQTDININNLKKKRKLTGIKLSEPLTSFSIPLVVQNGTVTVALDHKPKTNQLLSYQLLILINIFKSIRFQNFPMTKVKGRRDHKSSGDEICVPGEINEQKTSELRPFHQRHHNHCPKYQKPYQMAAQIRSATISTHTNKLAKMNEYLTKKTGVRGGHLRPDVQSLVVP